MSAKPMFVLSLAGALALVSQPVLAKGSHGGGGRSGGGHSVSVGARSSGGAVRAATSRRSAANAVPRGGGGIAEQRHPRAGTGRSYRPYYGGYYRGYPRGSFGASFYFGWPYYWGGYAYPYYGAGYYYPGYYAPYYDYGYGYAAAPAYAYDDDTAAAAPDAYGRARRADEAEREEADDRTPGRLRLEASPDDATVYVDDAFRGNARELRTLTLPPGRHVVELVRPGFAIERREITIEEGETTRLLVELRRR